MEENSQKLKPVIAILATHDNVKKHNVLVNLLDELIENESTKKILEPFWFVFSGGTFTRLFNGNPSKGFDSISNASKKFFMNRTTCLPSNDDGGVALLTYLISNKLCNIV